MKKLLLILACLLASTSALATSPLYHLPQPLPCQGEAPQRTSWPQGSLLWGTKRLATGEEASSVLLSVDLKGARLGGAVLQDLYLQDGRMVAPSLGARELVGARLQGRASDGQPVEVVVCSAEPSAEDPAMSRYRIEIWNTKSASWENPCVATQRVPEPRVLAVQGVWDERGARREAPGQFTLACENGAIAKCIDWGYKPWASKDGQPLRELHQACTRMARADYCGNGRSHTREGRTLDIYDELTVNTRTREATAGWDPARASFEAAWTAEGAWCLARSRDGRALETILSECPGTFEPASQDLGEGDVCTVRRATASPEAPLLRNHSYAMTSFDPG